MSFSFGDGKTGEKRRSNTRISFAEQKRRAATMRRCREIRSVTEGAARSIPLISTKRNGRPKGGTS